MLPQFYLDIPTQRPASYTFHIDSDYRPPAQLQINRKSRLSVSAKFYDKDRPVLFDDSALAVKWLKSVPLEVFQGFWSFKIRYTKRFSPRWGTSEYTGRRERLCWSGDEQITSAFFQVRTVSRSLSDLRRPDDLSAMMRVGGGKFELRGNIVDYDRAKRFSHRAWYTEKELDDKLHDLPGPGDEELEELAKEEAEIEAETRRELWLQGDFGDY